MLGPFFWSLSAPNATLRKYFLYFCLQLAFLSRTSLSLTPSEYDFVSWDPGAVLYASGGFTVALLAFAYGSSLSGLRSESIRLGWDEHPTQTHVTFLIPHFYLSTYKLPFSFLHQKSISMQNISGKSTPTHQAVPDYLGFWFGSKWDSYFLLHL